MNTNNIFIKSKDKINHSWEERLQESGGENKKIHVGTMVLELSNPFFM